MKIFARVRHKTHTDFRIRFQRHIKFVTFSREITVIANNHVRIFFWEK